VIRVLVALTLLAATSRSNAEPAQLGLGTARVTTPAAVLFLVTDVSATATTTAAATVSFDSAVLGLGQALRISVKAEGDVMLPGGTVVPATYIAWTTSSVINGVGMNGSLSKLTYTPVFEGVVGGASGGINLNWTMAAIGTSVRAGTGQATLRWKFEAITP
jgi:hypothetical protein